MIEIMPGGKLFFKTEEEYKAFCEQFRRIVTPELEKQRIQRLKSEREACFRIKR